MRILVISTLYPEPSKPKFMKDTNAIRYFVDEWVKAGHEVVVLHPYRIPIKDCIKNLMDRDRFCVCCTEQNGAKVLLTQTQLVIPHEYVPRPTALRRAAKKVKRFMSTQLSDFKPDVVAASFPLTNLEYCEQIISDTKALCVLHKSDILTLEKANEAERKQLIDRLYQCFDKICFRSDWLKARGIAVGIGNEESSIIYSGINESLIFEEKAVAKKAAEKEQNILNVVYAGNLVKQKNVDSLIRAIAMARQNINIQFRIIGDGSEKNNLMKLCEQLKATDVITFTGSVSRKTVVEEMRCADVFAMVSVNETFGLVYLEALAQGCIVIGTKDDGIDGILVDGKNGYLVKPHDVQQICNKLYEIEKMSKAERKKIIMSGYVTAVSMTDTLMSNQYIDELRKTIKA